MNNVDLIYGIEINWDGVGISDDEWDKGIEREHPVIEKIWEFVRNHDLVACFTSDISSYDTEFFRNVVIGVPQYKIEIKDSRLPNLKQFEMMKEMFEERTQNGILEKLKEVLGQKDDCQPDIHLTIEGRC